ncbi:hypothetical protein ACVCAH_18290 [Micromonospora sp. LZ34]
MTVRERLDEIFGRVGVTANLHVVELAGPAGGRQGGDGPATGRRPVAGRWRSGPTSRW